jgi:hypothetical protein
MDGLICNYGSLVELVLSCLQGMKIREITQAAETHTASVLLERLQAKVGSRKAINDGRLV